MGEARLTRKPNPAVEIVAGLVLVGVLVLVGLLLFR
jgi:hypothetical protein